jgi:HEAT repeat protein
VWIEILTEKGSDESAREEARRVLGPDGPFRQAAVPALLDALGTPSFQAHPEILSTLADHGPAATPGLIERLKRPDARVRAAAAEALGRVRPRPANAVPPLVAAMKDPVPEVRTAAATTLGRMRAAADAAIPALVTGLRDTDAGVRSCSAEALGRLVRKPGPAVGALARAVTDANSYVRFKASLALEQIGPAARDAVPILIQGLADTRAMPPKVMLGWAAPWIGREVVFAITVAVEIVRDELNDELNDGEPPSPRAMAAWALGDIGPAARAAVPHLIRALWGTDQSLQRAAAAALGRIGPDAAAAVPALLALARYKQHRNRWRAIGALGEIGAAARDAVPLLIEELGNDDSIHQSGAAEALGGIGPEARKAVPALTAMARDRRGVEPLAREAAARAVARIDPAFAAREGLEFAHLSIRPGRVPAVPLRPRPVTAEQTKRARTLIARLAAVDRPDVGLSATLNGRAFAPLPGRERMNSGLLTNHRLATNDAFRELVEMGPTALPSLLAALDDRTPTRLRIRVSPMGFAGFGQDVPRSPFNLAEKRATVVKPIDDEEDERNDPYVVTAGDVCFVAIGQIVGRPYQAVEYIPSGIVSICSPTASKTLRDRVRATWASADPVKTLFDSLLTDYATEGIFNGSSLDGWDEASDYQVEAVVRLLYYFPDETAPLVAARLRSLDVADKPGRDGWIQREVKNGVRTSEFVKAVAWCRAAPIREALAEIARKTDDPVIKEALATGEK